MEDITKKIASLDVQEIAAEVSFPSPSGRRNAISIAISATPSPTFANLLNSPFLTFTPTHEHARLFASLRSQSESA